MSEWARQNPETYNVESFLEAGDRLRQERKDGVLPSATEKRIAWLEHIEVIERGCPKCEEHYEALEKTGDLAWAPDHKVKDNCANPDTARRHHCTCNNCW